MAGPMMNAPCAALAMVKSNPVSANVYILHRQPYREDSVLIDGFSCTDGRIRLIGRGLRRKRNPLAPLLQPFFPLHGSWHLKGELGRLTTLESVGTYRPLQGDALYAGFYLNELLLRLLPLQARCTGLFTAYCDAIAQLTTAGLEATLRQFEQHLLYELGEGAASDVFACEQVYAEQCYRFDLQHGLVDSLPSSSDQLVAQGWQFAAIADNDFSDPSVLKLAKRINRVRLAPLLGDRPLKSRALWLEMRTKK